MKWEGENEEMKNYKLVNSEEVQDKAFRLGYNYRIAKENENCIYNTFLYLRDDMKMFTCSHFQDYSESIEFQEITQADFLDLPEPIKEGDWVKFESMGNNDKFIARVESSTDKELINCSASAYPINLKYYNTSKLTKEQIEVLELEND